MPVQWCTLTLPIPLLPLWTVQPVHSLGACTSVHFTVTYTSTPPMDHTACTEPQCLYNGALYLYLYLYSPYGPYSLYRASVPVQRCTLPLPISLFPYGPYSLYRASVPVQWCTLPFLLSVMWFSCETKELKTVTPSNLLNNFTGKFLSFQHLPHVYYDKSRTQASVSLYPYFNYTADHRNARSPSRDSHDCD